MNTMVVADEVAGQHHGVGVDASCQLIKTAPGSANR